MRFITISHGLSTHTVQVTETTTPDDIFNDPIAMTALGASGNIVLRDQDGNTLDRYAPIPDSVVSMSITNQGSTKG